MKTLLTQISVHVGIYHFLCIAYKFYGNIAWDEKLRGGLIIYLSVTPGTLVVFKCGCFSYNPKIIHPRIFKKCKKKIINIFYD